MTKYWAYRCFHVNDPDIQCYLINSSTCLISIDEMAVPGEYWGFCWITGEPVQFKLEEIQK